MEAGQAPLESSEAVEARKPDHETLGNDSAAGSSLLDAVDGGGENGLRVSTNGNEGLADGGFVELVRTRVVRTEVLSVKSSFVEGNDCVRVVDSEVDGVQSILEVRANVGESGAADGRLSDESVREMNSGSGVVEEVKEASAGIFGDFDDVPVVDSAAAAGVVESKDSGTMEMEDTPEIGNVFSVGDFVWGKVKNYPWWPGQIYDPSHASEAAAAKHNQKGRFLVAFSDGSFTWCNSSQLKPFEDNFEEMVRQSNTRSFLTSVDIALNDIGKLVELEMTCPCVLKGNQAKLDRPFAINTGVKQGVFIPERGSKCPVAFEPVELIEHLKNAAQVASVTSKFGLMMLRSTLCAFYQAKGGHQLPGFYEPQQIPGLEDKMEEAVLDIVICDGVVDVPVQGPVEEEMLSSRGALGYGENSPIGFYTSPGSRENQLHQRKQKSIAEIIANGGTGSDKLASKSGRKKRKAKDGGVDTLVAVPTMIESEVSGPLATPGSKIVYENGGTEAKKRGRKKKIDTNAISSVEGNAVAENDQVQTEREVYAESKEQNEKGYASRERKKSKYLSPPYTNPIQRPQKEALEPESQQVVTVSAAQTGKRKTWTTGRSMDCPIVKCSGEVLHTSLSEQLSTGHDSLNSSPDPMINELPVNDALSEIRSVALFTLHPEETDIDTVVEFLCMYRRSTYLEGSHYQAYKQQQQQQQPDEGTMQVSAQKRRGRKRKSINSKAGLFGEHLNQNGDVIVPHSKSLEKRVKKNNETARSSKRKSRPAAVKKNNETARSSKRKSRQAAVSVTPDPERKGESPCPASLFVTFGPGSSLPTKSELIGLYKKFGDLVEDETDVFYNNFCACVVFVRTSDAEKALNSSQESSPFGSANVTFRLRDTLVASKTQELNEKTPLPKSPSLSKRRIKTTKKSASNGEASQQNFIKEKLEMMMVMVEQSDGKMSPKLKSTLEGEMRGLLEKMKTMG